MTIAYARARAYRSVAAVALALGVATAASAEPDADLLGRQLGYPIGTRTTWFFDEATRVGSFSRLDEILPHHSLVKSDAVLPLPRAGHLDRPLTYRFDNQATTIDAFLGRHRITGLLILKDGKILVERYQYDRTERHRFVSHSMAKTITALAVGFAFADGRIASLDDPVETYVTALAGTPYGATTIRNTLRMASGVKFKELYDGRDDLATFNRLRADRGLEAALKVFTDVEAPQGTRFHYASSETTVLAQLVRVVTGKTLSAFLTEKLWQPMGAEAAATWIHDREGIEVGGGSFNATLRDYGRLGVLLANDGVRDERQIIPRDFLLAATDWKRQPTSFHPHVATPYFGYGYQTWLYPGGKRRFALLGVYGQSMFVDPELKLVMVITAAAKNASASKDPLARERDALWRGLVSRFGSW